MLEGLPSSGKQITLMQKWDRKFYLHCFPYFSTLVQGHLLIDTVKKTMKSVTNTRSGQAEGCTPKPDLVVTWLTSSVSDGH